MRTIKHDSVCEADARSRANLTGWGEELKKGCGCAARPRTFPHGISWQDVDDADIPCHQDYFGNWTEDTHYDA